MLRKYLIRFKIIDFVSFKIETDKNEFIKKLKEKVDVDSGIFSTMFEAFSSSPNVFKGSVGYDTFELKLKQKIMNNTAMLSKAKGKCHQERENVVFDIEINGWTNFMLFFLGFVLVFYLFALIMITTTSSANGMDFVFLPFLLIHGAFMIGIPIFMMRKSVKNLKSQIEKEFFYIAKR